MASRKGSKFKSGFYESHKAGRVHYRSSWEEECYKQLDADPAVKRYEVETVSIPYIFEGEQRTYFPDLKIIYADGNWKVAEIKPLDLINEPQNSAKFDAAEAMFGNRFVIITEEDLFQEISNGS